MNLPGRNVLIMVGLAAAMALLLLWELDGAAPTPAAALQDDGPSAAWSSLEPISGHIPHEAYTWPITTCGVTVTFFSNSLSNGHGAIFTFTPKSGLSFSSSRSATPYYFNLNGVYSDTSQPVALWHSINIELAYDPGEVTDVQENSLHAMYLSPWSGWLPCLGSEGSCGNSTVDIAANRVAWTTISLGNFDIAGYRGQILLPLALRNKAY